MVDKNPGKIHLLAVVEVYANKTLKQNHSYLLDKRDFSNLEVFK